MCDESRFQRVNPYNQFLPYAEHIDREAELFLREIKDTLKKCIANGDICPGAIECLHNLHKYIILYGLRFSKEDHIFFIKVSYEIFCTKNIDSVNLEKVAQIFIVLVKKKYLINRNELVLPWKPLFDTYYQWEDSSLAARCMLKAHGSFQGNMKSLIKVSRYYFSDSATKEMLEKWLPLLCPTDRTINLAMKYFSLFLPTTCDMDPSISRDLWFSELMKYWDAFSNSASWEVELFVLFSRLALHNVGRIDWSPYLDSFFTRIMNSFGLPVSYGNSGLRLSFGLASATNSSVACARFIVSAIEGGRGLVFKYLKQMITAMESYFQPANASVASDEIHAFITILCSMFVDRVHTERYNTKWASKTPVDKRLTDEDISNFVEIIKPIAFQVLFNNYDDDRRKIFNCLSTLRPELIIPDLLTKLENASMSITEPHRFTACIGAISASARAFVENYPEQVIDTLMLLLPGIDVNDIWKCADNFILMSDLLEMVWVINFAHKHDGNVTENELSVLSKTTNFENFVVEFTNKCFVLIENTSREQTRHETDVMDEVLNDEEMAVETAISDTFQKIMLKCSPELFDISFGKLRQFLESRILEAAVSGNIFAGMCKASVAVEPEKALDFFIPHLCQRINTCLSERVDPKKTDSELQFSLLLLSEVISVRGINYHTVGASYLLRYLNEICEILDKTLILQQKDEYEYAASILQNLFYNLVHSRPLQKSVSEMNPEVWDREKFAWAKAGSLETLQIEWYVPSENEMGAAQRIIDKYLAKPVQELEYFVSGRHHLEKEIVLRNLRQIYKIIFGASEVLEALPTASDHDIFSKSISKYTNSSLSFRGKPIRVAMIEFLHVIQHFLLEKTPDDTDSLFAVTSTYDVLFRLFGLDEEDLGEHIEEYKVLKLHRMNRMIRSKKHLESILIERIAIQHESHIWLKNLLLMECFPKNCLNDLFELCISHYSEVRSCAQDLLLKVLDRSSIDCYKTIIPLIIKCLQPSPEITHQMFKGALFLICNEKFGFFYDWKDVCELAPALVKAQHSDKPSIVDLLKEISIRNNRIYSEFSLYTLPILKPVASETLLKVCNLQNGDSSAMEVDNSDHEVEVDKNFLKLEQTLLELINSKELHWRHEQMAVAMMLLLINPDNSPRPDVVEMWLNLMVHDDRNIRLIAFQALECTLKVTKIKRKRYIDETITNPDPPAKPGLRPDNEWMQFKFDMTEKEVIAYWEKPFSVKPWMGFHCYEIPVKLRLLDEYEPEPETPVRALFKKYFTNSEYIKKFVEFNAVEHKKGEDFFSMDKALFHSMLYENFNDTFFPYFLPHIKTLAVSNQESDQRVAAELVFGAIRGSRFWSYQKTKALWEELIPVFKGVLQNVTSETIGDWETCLNGATNKHDPNRLRWLFDLLVDKDLLVSQGAFKESSFLRLLNKSIAQNYKVRDVFTKTFQILRDHWDHLFYNVRLEVSKMITTLVALDVPFDGGRWNMGNGYPTIQDFVDNILPNLNLNMHNPELANGLLNEDSKASCEDGMDVDGTLETEETQSSRFLQTASLFVINYIQGHSCSPSEHFFKLLPYFCQFVGTEKNQDASQYSLRALCFLSASIVRSDVLPFAFSVITKLKASYSWKAKLSMLEFVQVFIFTNFFLICYNDDYVSQTKEVVLDLLVDEHLQVRQKAAKVLGALFHCGFLNLTEQKKMAALFRKKIRSKMRRTKDGKRASFKKENIADNKAKMREYHSGVLGLCALVDAYPYEVPEFVPDILIDLEKHLHDPQPIPKTIKKCFQDFKRTHQDKWEEHKLKFTEDQLVVMTDLLISPNYYA